MLDAFTAEALKMRRHRGTWLMVWIYPIAVLLIAVGSLAYYALAGPGPTEPPVSAAAWIADSALFWQAPGSVLGRVLVASFAALLFAGEYSWNTWKLVIPARARWQLIAAKWGVGIVFVFLALLATDLIALATNWLRALQGSPIPEGVTLSALFEAHARAAAYAILPITYGVVFAGLFAVLTRSILAVVILSLVLLFVEKSVTVLGMFFYARAPDLTRFLIELLPPYHMANMIAWADEGAGLVLPLGPEAVVALSWASSFWALLAWIGAAGAATLMYFVRQDLN